MEQCRVDLVFIVFNFLALFRSYIDVKNSRNLNLGEDSLWLGLLILVNWSNYGLGRSYFCLVSLSWNFKTARLWTVLWWKSRHVFFVHYHWCRGSPLWIFHLYEMSVSFSEIVLAAHYVKISNRLRRQHVIIIVCRRWEETLQSSLFDFLDFSFQPLCLLRPIISKSVCGITTRRKDALSWLIDW